MSDNSYAENHYEATSRETVSILNRAQRLHDEYISSAEERRDEIIAEARTEAESIVSEAQTTANEILEEGTQKLHAIEERIGKLKELEYKYRLQLKEAADNTLLSLEGMTEDKENNVSAYDEAEDTPTFSFLQGQKFS